MSASSTIHSDGSSWSSFSSDSGVVSSCPPCEARSSSCPLAHGGKVACEIVNIYPPGATQRRADCSTAARSKSACECKNALVTRSYVVVLSQVLRSTTVKFARSEEHTSELQSRGHLVCRLLLEKKKSTISV